MDNCKSGTQPKITYILTLKYTLYTYTFPYKLMIIDYEY